MNNSGVVNGIEWSVTQISDREFKLKVGNLEEVYVTSYPTLFGMDVADVNSINRRLDEMQDIVEKGNE